VGTIVGKHPLGGDVYNADWPVPGGAMVMDVDLAEFLRLATADEIRAFEAIPTYRPWEAT
jgi:hypothetical protein